MPYKSRADIVCHEIARIRGIQSENKRIIRNKGELYGGEK